MSIVYKLAQNLDSFKVLDISLNKSGENTLSFSKESIYTDIREASTIVKAHLTIWGKDVTKVALRISNSLLVEDVLLEQILSSLSRYILLNSKCKILITHSGSSYSEKLKRIISIINKTQIARKLAMIPSDKATPMKLSKQIAKIFKGSIPGVKIEILNEKYLRTKGYNLIYAIGKSAENPCCMLVIERIKNTTGKNICILGKGITFDTGGLSIKPINKMITMKYDKTGAVNGAMALLQLMEELPDTNLIGIFPFAENAVSAKSIHPGDVIKSYLGKTVEIVDPDAEGRLILADALAHAHKYKPALIIDIATLTGHAGVINCWHNGYCYVMPENLKLQFENISKNIGERMITMPLWDDCSFVLKSQAADLSNSPRECSDSFVASLFLKEFLPANCDWIHIDIAHNLIENNMPKATGIHTIVAITKHYVGIKK
jgi:leucyl aminopeptidase